MYFVIFPLMAQSLPKLLRLPTFSSIIGSIIVLFILIYLAERLFFEIPCPEYVPLIREPAGARRFSWQTRLAFYTNCRDIFHEAYENVYSFLANTCRYLADLLISTLRKEYQL